MRSQCEEIKEAGDRAAGLTRQLLAFSRRQVPDAEGVESERRDRWARRKCSDGLSVKTSNCERAWIRRWDREELIPDRFSRSS